MDATIDLENSSALLGLDAVRRSQIPFATAHALTVTAARAQKRIRRELPTRFTIRNKFVERGVRIEKATKRRPQAVVFWRGNKGREGFAENLARLETGGIKRPTKQTIAIPRGIKRGKGGTITKGKRASNIVKRKNVFKVAAKGGEALLQRTGKGAPRLLYFLTPRAARIPDRWDFRETAADEARRVYPKEFGRAFAKAIRSRK